MSGIFVVGLALYFIPTIVAFARVHPSRRSIAVVNVLTGWTVLGWVAAFVWALMGRRSYALR